jgi:uncharacterized protein (TIGR03067 family)
MVCALFTIGFLASLAIGWAAREDEPRTAAEDSKMLQGKWVAKSAQAQGSKLSADEVKMIKVTFDGDKVTIERGDKTEKATYALDTRSKPRVISFTDDQQATRFGIYEFAGRELKLCLANPKTTPPAKFEAGHELNLVLEKSKD